MEIRQAYSVEQTVYFESQTDRVLIYVGFTAAIVLKYRGILSLDCIENSIDPDMGFFGGGGDISFHAENKSFLSTADFIFTKPM